jgi:hypothetical protein
MIAITIQLPALAHQDGGLWERVLPRFQKEAGALVVAALREHLGTDDLYQLEPTYAKSKARRRGYTHVEGKPEDQPLIFSGSLFSGVTATINGSLLEIGVEDGHGISDKGFDYAQEWESKLEYLEEGLKDVEDQLPELLETIIVEEMLLNL